MQIKVRNGSTITDCKIVDDVRQQNLMRRMFSILFDISIGTPFPNISPVTSRKFLGSGSSFLFPQFLYVTELYRKTTQNITKTECFVATLENAKMINSFMIEVLII